MFYPLEHAQEKLVITNLRLDEENKRILIQTRPPSTPSSGILWVGSTTIDFYAPVESQEKFHLGQILALSLSVEIGQVFSAPQ